MRTIDMSPLFRHTVGFDRMQRLLDSAMRHDASAQSFPPYNIESRGENAYRISMAVAGFTPEELEVTVKEQSLVVTGKSEGEVDDTAFLHKGIARRNFERRFELAEGVEVSGSSLVNGLLHIDLERVIPEEKQPRRIEIASGEGAGAKAIESQKAA